MPTDDSDLVQVHDFITRLAHNTFFTIFAVRRGLRADALVPFFGAVADAAFEVENTFPWKGQLDMELANAAARNGGVSLGGETHSSMHRAVVYLAGRTLTVASDADSSFAEAMGEPAFDENKLLSADWPTIARRFRERVPVPDFSHIQALLFQEFASVKANRGTLLPVQTTGPASRPSRKRTPRPGPTADRNRWLYEQYTTTDKTMKEIRAELSRMASSKGWDVIGSEHGITTGVDAHAKDLGEEPPRRRPRN